MRLEIETFGEKQFSRELLRFDERGRDMRPAFEKIADDFLDVEEHQFSTEGGYSGGWAGLAPSTVAYKARHNLDPRILHATLRLRRSLTEASGPDVIRDIRADEMTVGSKVGYGAFHQSGTYSMPRRRPVDLPDRTKDSWVKILQRFLVEGET